MEIIRKKNNMAVLNCYYAFTVLYYLFGRYHWNIPSYPILLSYLFICYLCINVGYMYLPSRREGGVFSLKRDYNFTLPQYDSRIKMAFRGSSILLIIFQVSWVVVFFDQFNIFNVLSNLGDNYYSRLETTFSSAVPIMQIRTLLWGLTLFSYPIGFLYFKQMSMADKAILSVTILIDVLSALNMGISKNIGDLIIVFIGILILNNVVNYSSNDVVRRTKKKCSSPIIVIMASLVAFLCIFQVIQSLRSTATTNTYINPYGHFASLNKLNFLAAITGIQSPTVIDQFGVYVSHAYTGLAYALELPFENTYLIGFSRALMEYASQLFGLSLDSLTYNARIDTYFGWHDGQWWPTAFVWMGNAVSMWLVPVVLFGLGAFFRHLEDDFAKNGNIITAALYCQILIMLVYLPCNMQIFQSRTSLFGTLLLIVLFILRNKVIKNQDSVLMYRNKKAINQKASLH